MDQFWKIKGQFKEQVYSSDHTKHPGIYSTWSDNTILYVLILK